MGEKSPAYETGHTQGAQWFRILAESLQFAAGMVDGMNSSPPQDELATLREENERLREENEEQRRQISYAGNGEGYWEGRATAMLTDAKVGALVRRMKLGSRVYKRRYNCGWHTQTWEGESPNGFDLLENLQFIAEPAEVVADD